MERREHNKPSLPEPLRSDMLVELSLDAERVFSRSRGPREFDAPRLLFLLLA